MLQRGLVGLLRYIVSRRGTEKFDPPAINNILVVELTRLGDVLAMLPSLTRIQTHFSHANIQVAVNQRYVSFLESLSLSVGFVGVTNPGSGLGVVRAIARVRKMSVDLTISMSSPRRNVLVALASKARFKLGYLAYVDSLTPFLLSTPVEAFGFGLETQVTYSRQNIYERSGKVCTALGVEATQPSVSIQVPNVYDAVRERLIARSILPPRNYVVLHPFSEWEYRNWGLPEFISLGERIVEEVGCDVVISCEEKNVERVRTALPAQSSLTAVVSSDLLELAALMKGASLVVSNDSGPLHLAALLNVKSVGLFGPASPELTAPPYDGAVYLYKKVECSPCHQRSCVRPDRPCMQLHEVDEVFAAATRVLGLPALKLPVATDG